MGLDELDEQVSHPDLYRPIVNSLVERVANLSHLMSLHVDLIANLEVELASILKSGGKILLCGNGGSAADAEHIAGEFVCRFGFDRAPLPAMALSADVAVITAIGNDFGFEYTFSRQVEAFIGPNDVLVALTTSGASPNVLEAVSVARQKGARTIGFTGMDGGALKSSVDICFCVPTRNTALIQEGYMVVWHILCGLLEQDIFGNK